MSKNVYPKEATIKARLGELAALQIELFDLERDNEELFRRYSAIQDLVKAKEAEIKRIVAPVRPGFMEKPSYNVLAEGVKLVITYKKAADSYDPFVLHASRLLVPSAVEKINAAFVRDAIASDPKWAKAEKALVPGGFSGPSCSFKVLQARGDDE